MTTVRMSIVLALVTLVPSAVAAPGMPRVIFSNIQSSPTSDVPGMPGIKFDNGPGEQAYGNFGRPFVSPSGDRWIFWAELEVPSGKDAVIAGSGLDRTNASLIVRTNEPTFFDAAVNVRQIREDMGINDHGELAFACDTSAPENADEIAARWTSQAGFELIAREGVQAADHPPGVGYGVGIGEVQILNDQCVAFANGALTGEGGGDALFLNSAIDDGIALVRSFDTVPEGQLNGPYPVESTRRFNIDATGDNHIYSAYLLGAGSIVAMNNVILAEYGRPLPGSHPGYFAQTDHFNVGFGLSPYNGHYIFCCPANLGNDNERVVICDGRVVAGTGLPAYPGSPWVYGNGTNDPFLLSVVNSHGDYIVFGVVAPGSGIVVMNSRTQLFTDNDVDLNGDGLPNDSLRAGLWEDSAVLTDDGKLFFTGPLISLQGQIVGEAIMWMPVPISGDPNCDGRIDFFDIDPFILALFDENAYEAAYPDCWHITADINRDGSVDFFDIDPFLACLFDACP